MPLRVEVRVQGVRQIQAAARALPRQGQDEFRAGSRKLARALATTVRAAGRAESRQTARAASTVRALAGNRPTVTAGPHPLLFAGEFGQTRRSGWYARPRYGNSPARQWRPHLGSSSYWFFKTVAAEQPAVDAAYREMADTLIAR